MLAMARAPDAVNIYNLGVDGYCPDRATSPRNLMCSRRHI